MKKIAKNKYSISGNDHEAVQFLINLLNRPKSLKAGVKGAIYSIDAKSDEYLGISQKNEAPLLLKRGKNKHEIAVTVSSVDAENDELLHVLYKKTD